MAQVRFQQPDMYFRFITAKIRTLLHTLRGATSFAVPHLLDQINQNIDMKALQCGAGKCLPMGFLNNLPESLNSFTSWQAYLQNGSVWISGRKRISEFMWDSYLSCLSGLIRILDSTIITIATDKWSSYQESLQEFVCISLLYLSCWHTKNISLSF